MDVFELIQNRPNWLKGAITKNECLFINAILHLKKAKNVLEIGVASGYSSAIILKTIQEINQSDSLYELTSLDNTKHCYFDNTKRTGIYLYKTLPHLVKHFNLKHFSTASIDSKLINKKFDVCFIDANHKHPYPALDLLFTIDYMNDDAVYILHDINLAKNNSNFKDSNGPLFLFDGLLGPKFLGEINKGDQHANIGAWLLPTNKKKQEIKDNIVNLIKNHKFEQNLSTEYLKKYAEFK